MSHRDRGGRSTSKTYAQELSQAAEWALDEVDLTDVELRRDCGWLVKALVIGALIWAWSAEQTLGERFQQGLDAARRMRVRGTPRKVSYQAFMKLLTRWTAPLVAAVTRGLRTRMEREFPDQFRIAGFVVLAGDGSKTELPRTQSHEARFSPAKSRKKGTRKKSQRRGGRPKSPQARQQRSRQKKADSPQMSLTMLLHVGLRLPWDWRIGSSDESEREHLRSMVDDLPPDALVTADCGFVGYDFWKTLLDSGRQFVIRVGGNVKLLKKLGTVREQDGTVYLWPAGVAKRGQPPLVLRLVVVQGARHPWYLVTSVLNPRRLSDRQVGEIYRRRWSVEVFFRHFKQTYGRGKLRSRKAEHAICEMQWSLLGLWTMLLYARNQAPPTKDSPPPCVSVARVLRAFDRALTHCALRPQPGKSLQELLRSAVVDSYERADKRSRGYPRKKYESATKAPRITRATQHQRQLAQQLATNKTKKGLTA